MALEMTAVTLNRQSVKWHLCDATKVTTFTLVGNTAGGKDGFYVILDISTALKNKYHRKCIEKCVVIVRSLIFSYIYCTCLPLVAIVRKLIEIGFISFK